MLAGPPPTNIRNFRTKFRRHDDLASGMCALVMYSIEDTFPEIFIIVVGKNKGWIQGFKDEASERKEMQN